MSFSVNKFQFIYFQVLSPLFIKFSLIKKRIDMAQRNDVYGKVF